MRVLQLWALKEEVIEEKEEPKVEEKPETKIPTPKAKNSIEKNTAKKSK